MTFKPRKPDLVARHLANIDEQNQLRSARRTYLLQAEACWNRDRELQRENEEISRQLRPEDAGSNVLFANFQKTLRPALFDAVALDSRLVPAA